MSTPEFEAFLARLYADPNAFGADLKNEALRFGLTLQQAEAIDRIDRDALQAAAFSFRKKRESKPKPRAKRSILDRLLGH